MLKKVLFIMFLLLFLRIIIGGNIDLDNLFNYANQSKPAFILKDNTPANNPITDEAATLGRVLFYDKKLSLNGTIACASCHHQEFAFSDTAVRSVGLDGGLTGRHGMRLINSRFATETRFFWDERAGSLEQQTTEPIKDHVEMGFSGENGNPAFDSLINRLSQVDYYQQLFTFAFGTPQITEIKIQQALAQFIRSIQSFDSKFDIGRAQVPNQGAPFPNFTADENAGKQLFLAPPNAGGAGCQGCHAAPEFDIDPNSRNNGVIGVAGNPGAIDLNNTRAPSLRDIFNPAGELNGPLMHNGAFSTINQVIDHYNLVPNNPNNNNLDPRLAGPGGNLQLTQQQKNQLIAFLKTLSGSDVYTNPKWSNPFDEQGNISVTSSSTTWANNLDFSSIILYPNPANEMVYFKMPFGDYSLEVYSISGQLMDSKRLQANQALDISFLPKGIYLISLTDQNQQRFTKKLIKH